MSENICLPVKFSPGSYEGVKSYCRLFAFPLMMETDGSCKKLATVHLADCVALHDGALKLFNVRNDYSRSKLGDCAFRTAPSCVQDGA